MLVLLVAAAKFWQFMAGTSIVMACLPCQPACLVSVPVLSACLSCQPAALSACLSCRPACLVGLPALSACLPCQLACLVSLLPCQPAALSACCLVSLLPCQPAALIVLTTSTLFEVDAWQTNMPWTLFVHQKYDKLMNLLTFVWIKFYYF